ncbi:copper amine oxidase N-terminal domain-containing protein [Caldinitratiruptor microaerophilus]|uniref:Copper amine oxidase-like N-terminal domain-containing protein n=1 Tax=Caldinitratiruptor microaerophilus TaxID=671077 RepID=A0AA35CN68_9FIRM|nr:copper amine oxidase N-terminal domain-containing protein [Caldinitratiruptor microaerophilus]BDG60385.1 hypothetical protein caldi_14750 [Caldinitratiruptor microaerophilus]
MRLYRLVTAGLVAGLLVAVPLAGAAKEQPPADTAPATGAPAAETGQSAGQEVAPGQRVRAEVHARVANRLRAMVEEGIVRNENAQANLERVIQRLTAEAVAAGDAASEAEALAQVEEALQAGGDGLTPAELDILAEVQARLGKRAEAMETLRTRLTRNARTRAAHEKLVALEAAAGTRQDLDTFVAGKKVDWDVRPAVEEGRTLVPVRKLVEALGGDVGWDPATGEATLVRGAVRVQLRVGSRVARVNGREVPLEVPARIAPGGRLVVPLRFVSEQFGLHVTWLEATRTIVVTEEPLE